MNSQDITRAIIDTTVARAMAEMDADPKRSVRKLCDLGRQFSRGRFQNQIFAIFQDLLRNDESPYYQAIDYLLRNNDPKALRQFGINLGYNSFTYGAQVLRQKQKELFFAIPWMVQLRLDSRIPGTYGPSFFASVIETGLQYGIYAYQLRSLDHHEQMEEYLAIIKQHPACAFLWFLSDAPLTGKQMELFEERLSDGTPTGTIVERGVAHSEGRCHGTAHIWIARANEKGGCEVLLQKRSAWKDSNPGCYDISSAGHLSAGDTYLEGALREIGEELGIHAEAEDLMDLGLLEKVSHGVFYGKPFHDHEVSAVYLYTKPVEAEKLHLQESEVEAVRWMDLKECQKAVREGTIPNCIDIRELEMIEKAWSAGEKTKDEE